MRNKGKVKTFGFLIAACAAAFFGFAAFGRDVAMASRELLTADAAKPQAIDGVYPEL